MGAVQAAAKHAQIRRTLEELDCSDYKELQTLFFNPCPGGRGRKVQPRNNGILNRVVNRALFVAVVT